MVAVVSIPELENLVVEFLIIPPGSRFAPVRSWFGKYRPPLAEGSYQRGRQRRESNGKEYRRPESECQPSHPYPNGPRIEHEMAVLAEGLCDHQGRKESGCQKSDDRVRTGRQFLAPDQNRPHGLDRGAGQGDAQDHDPERRHDDRPLRPRSAPAQAAITGTPGGTNGTNASESPAAIRAAAIVCPPSRSSSTSKAMKKAGKIASSPNRSTSPTTSEAKTPITVPEIQAATCGRVAPIMNSLSKRPPPRLARAQDASTTACPSSARRKGPPFKNGATATPIGKNREFRRMAATIAASAPPPVLNTATTANWADPEKAITEKTIGATTPQPREQARTPKEIPSTNVARAKGSPARAPAR